MLLKRSCKWQAQGAHQEHDMRRYLWVRDAIAALNSSNSSLALLHGTLALPIEGRMPCMHDCTQVGVYCQHQEGHVTWKATFRPSQ